ncbi:glycosyltransferase family 2 protein [Shewanella baltica]|uniref:glycosyltransferase family 2 protein n=1 Tax=Shewanella baltica TaxID=62322 RepID=UPI003D797886
MTNILVSIIIPIYNVSKYVEQCFLSVIHQQYQNIEAIFVNDGSSDGSKEILDNLKSKDSRVSVYHIENGGVTNARKYGFSKSNGDYIMFVDGDDYLSPDAVVKLLANVSSSNDIHISTGSHTCVYKNKFRTVTNLLPKTLSSTEYVKSLLANEVPCAIWGKLFHRNVISFSHFRFDRSIVKGEDLLFNVEVAKNSKFIARTSDCVYFYRMRKDSVVNSFCIDLDYFLNYRKMLNDSVDQTIKSQSKDVRRLLYLGDVYGYLNLFDERMLHPSNLNKLCDILTVFREKPILKSDFKYLSSMQKIMLFLIRFNVQPILFMRYKVFLISLIFKFRGFKLFS